MTKRIPRAGKFKVGDLAVLTIGGDENEKAGWARFHGQIVEVTRGKAYGRHKCGKIDGTGPQNCHTDWRYEIKGKFGEFRLIEVVEDQLEPLYKPGHVASWETCAWRPKKKMLRKIEILKSELAAGKIFGAPWGA